MVLRAVTGLLQGDEVSIAAWAQRRTSGSFDDRFVSTLKVAARSRWLGGLTRATRLLSLKSNMAAITESQCIPPSV